MAGLRNSSFSIVYRCRALAAKFLNEKNGDSQHTIHAMGHCHIDSGASYCSLRNAVGLCWPSSNWKSLLVTLMWNVSKVMCVSSPLPCSLAVALLRVHQEMCSQLVFCGGPNGGLSPLHLHLLTSEILISYIPTLKYRLTLPVWGANKFHCLWAYLQYCR